MCEKHFKNSRKGKEVVNMGLDMYAFSVKKENRIDTFHIRHDENETWWKCERITLLEETP